MVGRNGEHPTRFDAIAGNATQPYLPSVARQTLSTCQGSLASETGTIFPHRSTRANTFQRWHYNDYDDYELINSHYVHVEDIPHILSFHENLAIVP